MDVQKNSEQKQRVIATGLVAIFMISLLFVLKKEGSGPDTRAHTPLEDVLGKKDPNDVLQLLNFVPDDGPDLEDPLLLDSLTDYIIKNTSGKINEITARSRAEDLILGSMLFDIPIDMIVGHAHCESHFGTEGKGALTHNMLNIGNTDSGDKRIFSNFKLGTFAACVNIAGRIYHFNNAFGIREHLDYTSLWTNRDTLTGEGFLPNQLNYKVKNPFRGNKNPAGAYMSDILGPQKIWKQIANLRLFMTQEDYDIELVDKMKPGTVYYEKTVTVKKLSYYSFSYLVHSGGTKSIGELRRNVAEMLCVSEKKIAVIPYDHSRDNTVEEDKLFPSKGSILYFVYRISTE